MSETTPEPTPEETPEPTPDDQTEEEEAESNPPTEHEITEHEAPEGEPSPDEPAPDEPAPAPDEPQGLSPEALEKRSQKLDKAWDTYARAVGRILEEDATDLIPLTISPSAPPGFLHPYDAGRIPDEVKLPLLSFLGITQEVEYETSDAYRMCDACKGKGRLKTGSLVAGQESNLCPTCNGVGFVTAATLAVPNAPPLVAVAAPDNGGEPQAQPKDEDNWHTPRLTPDGMPNPNYGRTPDYWDRNYPVGHVG